MKQYILALLVLFLIPAIGRAQIDNFSQQNQEYNQESGRMDQGGSNHFSWGRDTTKSDKPIPIGLNMWRIDERFGDVIPTEADTVMYRFQNFNNTDGMSGSYNVLGNLGSPRLNRLFMDRSVFSETFFMEPYSYFYTHVNEFMFTNTKSPFTNLSYHRAGNTQDGEDRVRAYFATNINKISGIGFLLDYAYGRGFYNNQATSLFNGSLYGYYLGDRYNMHAWISSNHIKMGENGGIDDDAYITNPESFSQSFRSKDIPTVLAQTWNRNDDQTYFLTHRYNLGFDKAMISEDSIAKLTPADSTLFKSLKDSVLRVRIANDSLLRQQVRDSLYQQYMADLALPTRFVPVTSFIHTLKVRHGMHGYYSYETPDFYYTNHYYGDQNQVKDLFDELSVKNTLGIALREGFNKWAKAGLTAFATHELRTFKLPLSMGANGLNRQSYTENNVSVGGVLSKKEGKVLHYQAVGDVVLLGEDVGQFNVDGTADLNFRLFKDTITLSAHAYMKNLNPSFYYRHYQSQFTWWNNDLSYEFRTRLEGTLQSKKSGTTLRIGVENIKNYTYFAMEKTPYTQNFEVAGYSHNTVVNQYTGNIQVFSAILNQNFRFGIFNWENEIAYQKSSNATALPLPDLTLYSNLYIKFKIAKVLNLELGGDVRYFTKYNAPDYSPAIGQFVNQDRNSYVSIGNYPICNVYANLLLKHFRFYIMGSHINSSMNGNAFWAPHYPINPMVIRFGLSWNFYN